MSVDWWEQSSTNTVKTEDVLKYLVAENDVLSVSQSLISRPIRNPPECGLSLD